MCNKRTFIESITVIMGANGMLLFDLTSGSECIYSSMPRAMAVQCAYDILRAVEVEDMGELGEVIPFR